MSKRNLEGWGQVGGLIHGIAVVYVLAWIFGWLPFYLAARASAFSAGAGLLGFFLNSKTEDAEWIYITWLTWVTYAIEGFCCFYIAGVLLGNITGSVPALAGIGFLFLLGRLLSSKVMKLITEALNHKKDFANTSENF